MSAGSDTAHWPQPRAGSESEDATLAWLDALANGICPPEAFLGAMRDQLQGHRDEGWEVLSLLDQYYRRGKIKSEVFHSLKSSLEDVALNGEQSSARTSEIQAAPQPPAAAPPAAAPQTVAPQTVAPPTVAPPTVAPPAVAPPQAAAQSATAPQPQGLPRPQATPPPAAPQFLASTQTQAVAQALASARARSSTAVTAPAPVLDKSVPRDPRTAPAREARATRPAVADPKVSPISRPAIREVAVGDVLRGRYRVRGVVGHGGMGTVFEATDEYRVDLPTTGRRLAVKVLHTAVARREELLAELQREFQHLQLLSHPNIVRVHEFDRDGDVAFFTMELLSGGLLSVVLQARSGIALPRRHALAVIRDTGAALSHAHSRGVIHGDINPQNIFITHDGELRVLDFGASHHLLPERWAADNAVTLRPPVATPGYASCQQLEGQQPDVRDDLFAFACVVYVLLSGQHPFPKRTAIEARAQGVRPRRPPGLSGQQWRVLREGLRWDRERRPSNVQEWLDRFGLGAAAPRLPVMAVLVNTASPRDSKPILAASILFALLAAGGYWAFTHYDSLGRGYDSLARNFTEWRNQSSAPRTPEVPAASAPESLPAPNTPAPAPAAPRPAARSAPAGKASPAAKPVVAAARPAVVAAPAAAAPAPAASHPAAAASERLAAVRAGNAGPVRVEMAADTVDVSSGETTAHISVRRRGNIHGVAGFRWWTESGTAKPGVDFAPVMPRVASIADGSGSVGLDIPVLAARRSAPKSFYVVIDQSDNSGATLGSRALTMVTLLPPE